ncbi:MAG: caspase family protein [Pseudorhodoplanes sp.]|jgi:uncharacterized caspase-like protein|nr:caspase family protein [Pseudorhodoplanes sp.]
MSRTGFALRLFALLAAAFCLWQKPAAAQVSPRLVETAGAARQINTGSPLRTASLENGAAAQVSNAKEKRLALVIGNSNYEAVKALPNPANDARAVAQLLNTAGFEVVMAFDLNRDTLRQVVSEFSARITESGPNSAALVYYAGHGLQVDGENFLVPVDAKIEKEEDVPEQAVRLADVMQALENAPSRIRIVILDACRNNPFSALGDASGKGLAIVDAPAGSIVAYATAPGTEAFDGAGQHSPYTAAFIKSVKQPGLPIEQLFKRVRVLVADATDAKQMPWESSSLTSDFVFFATDPNANVAAVPAVLPEKVAVAQLATRSVEKAYEVVVAEDSVEYYEEFVRIYPAHPLCERIRRLLSLRLQMIAWRKATKSNSADAYKTFLSKHGNGDFAGNAKKLLERPRLVSLPVAPKIDVKTGPVIGFPKNDNGKTGPVIGFPKNDNIKTGPVVNVPNGQNGSAGGIKTGPIVKPNGPLIPFPQNPQNGQNGSTPGKVTTLPKPDGIGTRLPNNGQVVTLPKPGEGANKDTGIVKLPNGAKITTLPVNRDRPVIRRDLPNGNTGIVAPKIKVQPKPISNVKVRREIGIQRKAVQREQSFRQSAGGFTGRLR